MKKTKFPVKWKFLKKADVHPPSSYIQTDLRDFDIPLSDYSVNDEIERRIIESLRDELAAEKFVI